MCVLMGGHRRRKQQAAVGLVFVQLAQIGSRVALAWSHCAQSNLHPP